MVHHKSNLFCVKNANKSVLKCNENVTILKLTESSYLGEGPHRIYVALVVMEEGEMDLRERVIER